MQRLSTKLIILLILAALIPLCLYGILSIWTSRKVQYQTLSQGNLRVAARAAEQIQLYVDNSIEMLKAIAENINRIGLRRWQQEAVIKNYVLNFPEFQEIYITDGYGNQLITTRVDSQGVNHAQEPAFLQAIKGQIYRSEVTVSPEFIPIMTVAVPLRHLDQIDGIVAAKINLMDMWNLVDSIRIGKEGYALVVSKTGRIIAHGDNAAKPLILQGKSLDHLEIVRTSLRGNSITMVYKNDLGKEVLGVAVPLPSLHWALIIEQPTAEAFYTIRRMTYELVGLVIICLIIMLLLGYWGGKSQIVRPIQQLIAYTRRIAQGELGQRVSITSAQEFAQLGEAFNRMSERLLELQEEIRRNERTLTFARLAAGLVHDLRHPIRNIENCSRLIQRLYDDETYRLTFQRTVEREFSNINRFLTDLHNLTHPTPLQPIELEINKVIREVLETFSEEAAKARVELVTHLAQEDVLKIQADRFALERVLRNLILNAIQAMPDGGRLVITTRARNDQVEIEVEDTGCGIPPEQLKNIFTDFTTTKKKGLGLGLAICKKLVEEHQGTITVRSTVGKGSCFKLTFKRLILPDTQPTTG